MPEQERCRVRPPCTSTFAQCGLPSRTEPHRVMVASEQVVLALSSGNAWVPLRHSSAPDPGRAALLQQQQLRRAGEARVLHSLCAYRACMRIPLCRWRGLTQTPL